MGARMEQFLRNVMGEQRADRFMERRTGQTRAQRMLARNDPDQEIGLSDFTDEELEVWREGGDPFTVGPQQPRERIRFDQELGA